MTCHNHICENHQKNLGETKFCAECGQQTASTEPQGSTCRSPGCNSEGKDLGKMKFCPACGTITTSMGSILPLKCMPTEVNSTLESVGVEMPQVQLPPGYAPYQGGGAVGRNIIGGDQNITNSTVMHYQDQTKQLRQCAVSGRQAEVTHGHVCPSCGLWVHQDCFDRDLMRCEHCSKEREQRARDNFRSNVQEFLVDGVISKAALSDLRSLGAKLRISTAVQDTVINQIKQEALRTAATHKPMSLIDQTRLKSVIRGVQNKVFSSDPVAGRAQLDSLRMLHRSYPENEKIAALLASILCEEMLDSPTEILPEVERVLAAPAFEHDTPQKYLTRAMVYRGGTLLGNAQVTHSKGEGNWAEMLGYFNEKLRESASSLEHMFPDSVECHALQIAMMIDAYHLSGDQSIREDVNLLLEGASFASEEGDVSLALKAAYANARADQQWGEERAIPMGQGLAQTYFGDLFSFNLSALLDYGDGSNGEAPNTGSFEDTLRLATKGDPEAQFKFGLMYQDAEGEENNDAEAARWFRKAAEQGHAAAQNKMGNLCKDGSGVTQNYVKAMEWYLLAADQGYPGALSNLGSSHEFGLGTPINHMEAVKWYRKASDKGSPYGSFRLGLMYWSGRGVIQDDTEAVRWFRKAVDQGHAGGQLALGDAYADGRGVEQDDAEAVKWYRLAAEQGDADAQNRIGYMYANGRGVEEDDAEAVKWFRLAAEQGDALAQYNLGDFYANGYGVEQDDAVAVKWYRLAAEQGDADAQYNLGDFYAEGRGVEQDDEQAVKWYRLAAEQGNADAQYNLGDSYAEGRGIEKDDAEAVKWFRLAAEQGNAVAQYFLGVIYADGRRVEQDYAEAVKWYRLSAEQDDADAQCALACMYKEGLGLEQDDTEAVKWYRLAAEQGDAFGQGALAWMYSKGRGVEQDYAEAAKWFGLAAEQGDADAQYNLGLMYAKGRGVQQDDVEAVKWYRLAAAQGIKRAQHILDSLEPQDLGAARNQSTKAHTEGDNGATAKFRLVTTKVATPPPLPTSSRGSEIGMIDVASIVYSDAENLRDEHIFIHPSIPDSKLANARRKMKCQEHHVIMLIDNTIFGSAKDGAIVTPNGLYVHNMGETARFLEWKQIHTVQGRDFLGGVTLLINGLDFLTMNLPSAGAAHAFANLARRISEAHHQLK